MKKSKEAEYTRRDFLSYFITTGSIGVSGCLSSDRGRLDNSTSQGDLSYPTHLVPEREWYFETNGEVKGDVAISNGVLYFGSYDGYLYAVEGEEVPRDAQNSRYPVSGYNSRNTNAPDTEGPKSNINEKWRFSTHGIIHGAPAVVGGDVYFGSEDNFLYSVSVEDGEENWKFDTGGVIGGAAPAVSGDVVYVPSGYLKGGIRNSPVEGKGRIQAIDRVTGEEIWTVERERGIQCPPNIHDGVLYHGCRDSNVYALDPETGDEIWSFEGDGIFCASKVAVNNDLTYIGSEDHSMYALDSKNGEVIWEFETEDTIVSSPAVTDDAVYFGSRDDYVYAVEPETGEEIWSFETGHNVMSSPAYKDGIVYISSHDGYIYAVEAETGEEIWKHKESSEGLVSSPVVADNTVYYGSLDGNVYAVKSKVVTEEEYEEYRMQAN